MGAMDTWPAMSETLFWEDRLLGLGDEGERANGWITGVVGRRGVRTSRGEAGGVIMKDLLRMIGAKE